MQGLRKRILLILGVLESKGHVNTKIEKALCHGKHWQLRLAFRNNIKEIEVAAPVVDVEELLVKAFTMYIRRFAGTTTNHLPELNL